MILEQCRAALCTKCPQIAKGCTVSGRWDVIHPQIAWRVTQARRCRPTQDHILGATDIGHTGGLRDRAHLIFETADKSVTVNHDDSGVFASQMRREKCLMHAVTRRRCAIKRDLDHMSVGFAIHPDMTFHLICIEILACFGFAAAKEGAEQRGKFDFAHRVAFVNKG